MTENRSPLENWAQEALGLLEVQVQVRLRGNHLHILCEAEKCPEMNFALDQFSQALSQVDIESLLPPNQPRIYQMFLCGRTLGRRRPDWTVKLDGHKVAVKSQLVNQPLEPNHSQINSAAPPKVNGSVSLREYSEYDNDIEALPQENLTNIVREQTPTADINHHDISDLLPNPPMTSVLAKEILKDNNLFSSPPLNLDSISANEEKSLGQLQEEPESENEKKDNQNLLESTLTVSSERLARYGYPDAIASYLSEILGGLGVCVNVNIREKQVKEKLTETTPQLEQLQTENLGQISQVKTQKILWVSCEAGYSPDPSLLAEPIAQKLRDLNLKDFHEALISLVVQGEATPDWMLRVDLTPPDLMLQEWASWGDIAALEELLQKKMTATGVIIRATLKESTLHLFCSNTQNSNLEAPEKQKTIDAIASSLSTIAPRGIQAATIYGCIITDPNRTESPLWIDWLDLPASKNSDLATSAKELASQGNYEAVSFLLNKLLNPDLNHKLQTGGIRVLLLPKGELLHVMSEAPTCPSQSDVGPPIAKFLRQLQIPGVSGLRVYGRRAGQKLPLWRYGINFSGTRLHSEVAPEFAASTDIDLLLGKRADRAFLNLTPETVEKTGWKMLPGSKYGAIAQLSTVVQNLLIGSRLFIPNEEHFAQVGNSSTYNHARSSRRWAMAIAYATFGILFTVQTDLQLGQLLQRVEAVSKSDNCQGSVCQTSTEVTDDSSLVSDTSDTSESSSYPSFNSPQLDEQLVRYQQYLAVEKKLPDILIVGSSRALRGVNPTVLEENLAAAGYTNLKVYNFGVNGATVQVVDLIVRRILPPEQLPPLIIFADGVRAVNSGRVDRTFDIIADSEGYKAVAKDTFKINTDTSEKSVNFWENLQEKMGEISVTYQQRDRLKSLLISIINNPTNLQFLQKQEKAENDSLEAEDISQLNQFQDNGFLPISIQFKPEKYYQNYAKVSGKYDADYANFQLPGKQTEALKNLLEYTESIGIDIVFVNMPLTEAYLDTARTAYELKFQEYMQQLSGEYSNFVFRDFVRAWPQVYDNFSDPSHLNMYGAIAVSQKLVEDNKIPWQKP
ncbi:MAG: DUF1574 family protein [Microcoleaceae cyanobacterium MO_207.B10]|nr:DUF1574 family protein [Microcoleaceae cyanobacterium MO_207.B10]